jgi:hypothetical protein
MFESVLFCECVWVSVLSVLFCVSVYVSVCVCECVSVCVSHTHKRKNFLDHRFTNQLNIFIIVF